MPKQQRAFETRSLKELRSVSDSGEFEGYIAVWGTTDSYNSTFVKGCFRKTIQERASRIKVLYNHTTLIGSSLEIREDNYGCWVRGRINLETQAGKDVHALLKAGDLDGLSFGFNTITDEWVKGVREIREVKLYEYGPVDFPSNEAAEVSDVRAARIMEVCMSDQDNEQGSGCARGEERSTDFNETARERELNALGYRLLRSIEETLDDIWWSSGDRGAGDMRALFDKALADFHAAYMEFVNEWFAFTGWPEQRSTDDEPETRSAPSRNELATAVGKALIDGGGIDRLAATTSLTLDELRALRRGHPIAAADKLAGLGEAAVAAHREERSRAAEALFRELREGMRPAEIRRAAALLHRGAGEDSPRDEPDADLIGFMREIRSNLEAENG